MRELSRNPRGATPNKCSRMGVQNKEGQAGEATPGIPGLTTSKEWLMPSVPMTEDTRKAFAREFLYLSQCYLNEAKALRKRRIELAQKYGLTNIEIGEELGMTEAAVRMIIKRGDA